jgi:hypothetical protein
MYGTDKRERELVNECLVEDSVDKNADFPYADFLQMLYKLIQAKG